MICPRHNQQDPWLRPPALIPATAPGTRCIVEVGPGRGEFLWHLARTETDAHIIGIEIGTPRFVRLRRDKAPYPHVSLIYGDARIALTSLELEGQVDTIYINFPDPWPKRKHSKNRLMQPQFIDSCARALRPGGQLRFTTDWPDYAESTRRALLAHELFMPLHEGGMTIEHPEHFPTYFYQKWISLGRNIHFLHYQRA